MMLFTFCNAQAAFAVPTIETSASATSLIDVQSGRILYSEDGDVQLRIASLTKIMTAIVAIEKGSLSDMVKVSKRAAGKEGSSIYLKVGEEMSLSNMLYGLMLRSGNDAATAIAEHVGGSEAGFVYLMNEKAKELGLSNTQFKNPHGLDEEGHYSSANDLAVLTAYALKNKVFAEIVRTEDKKAPNPYEDWDYSWHNKNKMLDKYEGADGVKTGYTKKAFRCLVSSATRNGQQLVAVTINDGDDWKDHQSLLDWGFKYFPHSKLAEKKQVVSGTSYVYGRTFNFPLEESEVDKVTAQLKEVNKNTVHYALGERGRMIFYLNGQEIGHVPVYDVNSPRLNFSEQSAYAKDVFRTFKQSSSDHMNLWESFKRMFKQH